MAKVEEKVMLRELAKMATVLSAEGEGEGEAEAMGVKAVRAVEMVGCESGGDGGGGEGRVRVVAGMVAAGKMRTAGSAPAFQ